ncbi:MAG: DinB family protein [Acidobacteriota bacterium]|nr:DinB family protein [Acidobacteriota bacterium]
MPPAPHEAPPYYFTYINQAPPGDILPVLTKQLDSAPALFHTVTDENSLHSYAPGKWTIRQVLNHLNDTERVLSLRAFWFARGFDSPLPSFDQEICSASAAANAIPWSRHIEEFRAIRSATIAFFENLPPEAWTRSGIASDNSFTVRAMAYIIAGHVAHHTTILQERYLKPVLRTAM